MIDPTKPIFTTRDIAELLERPTQFVREQVAAGVFPCSFKQKGSCYYTYRFSLNDVRRYNEYLAAQLEKKFAA